MSQRPLDEVALLILARKLRHQRKLEAARAFATTYYGPKAVKLCLITGDEYNDENDYSATDRIEVYDADDNELDPDLSLSFWQEHPELADRIRCADPDEFQCEYGGDIEYSDRQMALAELFENHLPDIEPGVMYTLTDPDFVFPKLFIEIEEEEPIHVITEAA